MAESKAFDQGHTGRQCCRSPGVGPVAHRISEDAATGLVRFGRVTRLEQAGAKVIHGSGRLDGAQQVAVDLPDGRTIRYTARIGIVVNPGTRTATPPIEGLAGTPYWTNRDAVQTREVPQSLIVLGGAATLELRQAFARFGVAVTIVEPGPHLSRGGA